MELHVTGIATVWFVLLGMNYPLPCGFNCIGNNPISASIK
jgi:hypothetical protein